MNIAILSILNVVIILSISPQTLYFFISKLCSLALSIISCLLTDIQTIFSPARETLNYLAHLYSHQWSCVVFGPWITGRPLTSQQTR